MSLAGRSPSSEPLLRVRDLATYFPTRHGGLGRAGEFCRAVDGVTFQIGVGTTLGLVGESGCGKTTVGRTILRLVRPTRGEITFDGADVLSAKGSDLRQLRRNMQLVFQDPFGSFNPRMTVGRIVGEPLAIHRTSSGRRRRERVTELLQAVGLSPAHAERYSHELSGGQRQRVGIARAIALEPRFIICDEPVSALDVSIQSRILNLLSDLQRGLGLTYLFITHNLAVVRHFCDRVAVMYLGKIVEIGEATDLYAQQGHPYTTALWNAVPEPDPYRRRQRMVLPGDIASPINPPTGCTFHNRCPYTTGDCRQMAPALQTVPGLASTHLVACHHAAEILVKRA